MITWPLYYIGQWCLFIAAMRYLQRKNKSLLNKSFGNDMLGMMGVDTSDIDPKNQMEFREAREGEEGDEL